MDGRFDSEDPSGFSDGDSDLYRYALNDVTANSDPNGLVAYFKGPICEISKITLIKKQDDIPKIAEDVKFDKSNFRSSADPNKLGKYEKDRYILYMFWIIFFGNSGERKRGTAEKKKRRKRLPCWNWTEQVRAHSARSRLATAF